MMKCKLCGKDVKTFYEVEIRKYTIPKVQYPRGYLRLLMRQHIFLCEDCMKRMFKNDAFLS